MTLKSLYRDYFQKSRVFLYPILEIRRGVSVTPIETYVCWDGHYKPEDKKFIVLYHLRNDKDFISFEKSILLGNKLFYDFKPVEENKAVYVFDFSIFGEDWDNVIAGNYSKLSKLYKKKIENFYGRKDPNFAYIESFLYPEKYFSMYSQIIDVPESLLKEVGELCSKIDLDKETLNANVKSLELRAKTL
jgi:hypothetical protein